MGVPGAIFLPDADLPAFSAIYGGNINNCIPAYAYWRFMSREKIKVPGKVYEELTALQREIHFTLDHNDTVKKAEDRGYMAAANWIHQNENAYKVGFSWGFEPIDDEPQGMIRDIPQREAPQVRRTISHPPTQTIERKEMPEPRRSPSRSSSKRSSGSSDGGIFSGIKKWLGKYF